MGINKLIMVTILVRDQEEALDFYVNKLGFEKRLDLGEGNKRWLTVAPRNQKEIAIILRKPHADDNELITKELDKQIGKGTLWSFTTNDCNKTYEELKNKGVVFVNPPQKGNLGTEAIFEDLYGNRFSLIEII